MTPTTTTSQLVNWVAAAFIAQMLLTSVHHVYGGPRYASAVRLAMPLLAGVELLIVLGLLFWYRRTRSRLALALFSLVAALVGVVQGLFHTLYGHAYKDILYLVGVPANQVRNFFLPILPNDFVYPPNDVFFEATGILELATIGMITLLTYLLIRERQQENKLEG